MMEPANSVAWHHSIDFGVSMHARDAFIRLLSIFSVHRQLHNSMIWLITAFFLSLATDPFGTHQCNRPSIIFDQC
jgi:hypothetical protein